MQARGYSLVEMVMGIAIASILLAVGTLKFNAYLKRYRTEAQVRAIHHELLKTRTSAVYQRRATLFKLYPGRFEVYSSSRDGVAPLMSGALEFPISCNGNGTPSSGYPIEFDSKGLPNNRCSICVEGEAAAAVDSVVISAGMVRIGKKDLGDDCSAENITLQ